MKIRIKKVQKEKIVTVYNIHIDCKNGGKR